MPVLDIRIKTGATSTAGDADSETQELDLEGQDIDLDDDDLSTTMVSRLPVAPLHDKAQAAKERKVLERRAMAAIGAVQSHAPLDD